jgi:hypothetical protein
METISKLQAVQPEFIQDASGAGAPHRVAGQSFLRAARMPAAQMIANRILLQV